MTGRRRLRVVFVDHVARLSGGEIALVRLLQATRDAVEAHVVLGEDGPLRARLEAAGANVHVLPMPAALRDVRRHQVLPGRFDGRRGAELCRYVWRLRRLIRQLRADIVHTNSLKASLYGAAAGRLAGVPVVWHVRDRIAADYLPRPAVVLVRVLARGLPTAIVANSQATLDTLPRRARGRALSHPVVHDVAPPAVRDLALAPTPRRDDGRVDDEPPLRIGIIGRLAPWKGHRVFLDAFARAFADDRTEAWVIGSALFGEQGWEVELRAQADRLGIAQRVVWRGFREDIFSELAHLDVLVHASTVPEPFGQVIVEGMAAGVPVVAAAAGGPLEIIRSGVDGLLVTPGDAAALAGALRRLRDDPAERARLGAAGRVSSRRFSPEATRRRLLDAYDEVLSRPGRSR